MMNQKTLSGNKSEYYLRKQSSRESNARSYPRRLPIVIDKAEGIYLTDVDGKRYIDCLAGAGTLALGHNHPVIIDAIQKMINARSVLHTLDLTTPIKEQFVDELFKSLPREMAGRSKIQFCGPSGADAIEAAVKLVKTATNRRSILSFHGGYHGMTHGALSLTGNTKPKQKIAGLMPDVHFLPYPYSYRCPFGVGKDGHKIGIRYISNVLSDLESGIAQPAAMILEVIQGEGGVIVSPDEWIRDIREITAKNNIPLIVDEVQTGIGRTGAMFAFEHAGIKPDVIVLSKAIGGSLPLSVMIYDKDLDVWEPGAHAGTFRGNQMAMACGIATLRFIRENHVLDHVNQVGSQLMDHLQKIQKLCSCIGEVRGRGLMVGVEIVNTNEKPDEIGSYPAYPELARLIQQECFRRGLILELGGRGSSVIRFLPPLIVTSQEVDTICEIFQESVAVAEQTINQKQIADKEIAAGYKS